MKQDIFNQYVTKVVSLFSIKKEQLFSKSKKREIVDARQLLYYLCAKRPMSLRYIQKYMEDNGYAIHHPSLINGIARVEEKMKEDGDYVSIIKDIEKSVFI
jgi:chromosomal replication initiation ATPase DnaA